MGGGGETRRGGTSKVISHGRKGAESAQAFLPRGKEPVRETSSFSMKGSERDKSSLLHAKVSSSTQEYSSVRMATTTTLDIDINEK